MFVDINAVGSKTTGSNQILVLFSKMFMVFFVSFILLSPILYFYLLVSLWADNKTAKKAPTEYYVNLTGYVSKSMVSVVGKWMKWNLMTL